MQLKLSDVKQSVDVLLDYDRREEKRDFYAMYPDVVEEFKDASPLDVCNAHPITKNHVYYHILVLEAFFD
jgi:hypothetical protein